MESPKFSSSYLDKALLLQRVILSLAEGNRLDNNVYMKLRTELIDSGIKRSLIPRYVRELRNEGQLWAHFKKIGFETGAPGAIKKYIYESFEPLFKELESKIPSPPIFSKSDFLASIDLDGIHRTWPSAIRLGCHDPEAAIISAHTLLEKVCKLILDEAGEVYGRQQDLLKLYVRTSWVLNLAPSQHTEDTFRAVVGSCQSVVHNLETLCRSCGDLQGSRIGVDKPSPRHATLAVNLAWTVASFLLQTWQEEQGQGHELRQGDVQRI